MFSRIQCKKRTTILQLVIMTIILLAHSQLSTVKYRGLQFLTTWWRFTCLLHIRQRWGVFLFWVPKGHLPKHGVDQQVFCDVLHRSKRQQCTIAWPDLVQELAMILLGSSSKADLGYRSTLVKSSSTINDKNSFLKSIHLMKAPEKRGISNFDTADYCCHQ